jgi:hypothetical protein
LLVDDENEQKIEGVDTKQMTTEPALENLEEKPLQNNLDDDNIWGSPRI